MGIWPNYVICDVLLLAGFNKLKDIIGFTDNCTPNPCLNDGTCYFNGEGDRQCHCVAGYIGYYCESGIVWSYIWIYCESDIVWFYIWINCESGIVWYNI